MGILSTQAFNLLVKNAKAQIDKNDKFIDSSKVEIDTLVSKAQKQISAYFDSLYAMDLPINCYVKCSFDNNDGEGEFYVVVIHENNRKLTYFEYDSQSKRIVISNTHQEEGVDVDYLDEDSKYYDKRWSHGFKEGQDPYFNERVCKSLMQCFDEVKNKMNMKILSYVEQSYNESEKVAKFKKKVISTLKENLIEDNDE